MSWTDAVQDLNIEHGPKRKREGQFTEEPVPRLNTVCLADIEPKKIEWIWPGRIAIGKNHLLVGNPGLGKSFFTIDVAARISTGELWPDRSAHAPQGEVLFLCSEDGIADTVRPRLDAHGADCSKVFLIRSIKMRLEAGSDETDTSIKLDRDIEHIDNLLNDRPNVRIVVIDPVTEYLGHCDSHKNAEVRAVLAPLSTLAEKHGVAILNVSHLNKSAGGPAIYRAMGSLAFTAHSRIAYAFVGDDTTPGRVKFLPLKNNIYQRIPGLAFSITDGRVTWETEACNETVDEAMRESTERKSERLDEACEWLKDRLDDQCWRSSDIWEDAKSQGIAFATYRRAKEKLGVVSAKSRLSNGEWFLSLPKTKAPLKQHEPHGPDEHVHSLSYTPYVTDDVQEAQDVHGSLRGNGEQVLKMCSSCGFDSEGNGELCVTCSQEAVP